MTQAPLQLTIRNASGILDFASSADAAEAARELGLEGTAPAEAITASGRVWVLRNATQGPDDIPEILNRFLEMAQLHTDPYADGYRCPLDGVPRQWLQHVQNDHPAGSPTRLLADAVTAVLDASATARAQYLSLDYWSVDEAMTPALATLAGMWGVDGNERALDAVWEHRLSGPAPALVDVLRLARALGKYRADGRIGIVEFEAEAAKVLNDAQA